MCIGVTDNMTTAGLCEILGAETVREDIPVRDISNDTRTIEAGDVYIALRGENFDGHSFASAALSKGASAVICEYPPENCDKSKVIIVENTLEALGKIAKYHKSRINPFTVAVTGSVGKTTTKQFLYSVFSNCFETLCTEGNYNNEIGLPKTIFRLKKCHQALIAELGMSAAGEISRLSRICEPDVAVITNIGSSHIEFFGTKEKIRDAKLEIRDGLKKGGKLIVNGDDPLLRDAEGAITVGIDNPDCAWNAVNIGMSDYGVCFDAVSDNYAIERLTIPVTGRHNVYNALYAVAAGMLSGIPEECIRSGLKSFENTGMRQKIYRFGGYTVIEDCYNASPESMKASLGVLSEIAKGRKIAVLGEMRELGEKSEELHRAVGEYAAESGVDLLFTFGSDALSIAGGAIANGTHHLSVISIPDIDADGELADLLRGELHEGDCVLFKASRAVELERVIKKLKGE